MRVWPLLTLTALLVACAPGGVRQPDGTYNLGPNALGDDPLARQDYPDYPTYAVNKEYMGDNLKRLSTDQQICAVRAVYEQLPQHLQKELDDFATGKVVLMESEYMATQKRVDRHFSDPEVGRAAKAYMAANCGFAPD